MTVPKSQTVDEPTDPDVDLHVPAQRQQSWRAQGPIVAVVALGGAIGASARYGASHVQLLLGTGLCGALTTYSTFSYETLRLAEDGARFFAAANVIASVVAGLGAVFVGVAFAEALWA
ncbi:CrcB family protein [Streptomyces sp. SID12501]|uniref:Fluoride-specific ion channel FluC n=1 Tax=Streptomyces sp. SID12501 TaxID=2706042 RepID=A0A6B3BU10_9ACTN|nr:CrcB family protein [Streptomyces sp. SID12501]NEC87819.1 CrcB family protein [Streptomyces sp. SID12501]